jgi:hypothetical protein
VPEGDKLGKFGNLRYPDAALWGYNLGIGFGGAINEKKP